MSEKRFACVAIVPAGGSGARLGAEIPKQYLEIAQKTVLHHTLNALSQVTAIEHIFIAVQADDQRASTIASEFDRVSVSPTAGATRAETVSNTLTSIQKLVQRDAWVLVHDAARPCVTREAIDRLMQASMSNGVGGLLAVPVADTMKRADSMNRVAETVARENLWRAQTPQMFRFETLSHALAAAPDATDESQAVEAIGLSPALVMGEVSNIKITYSDDLAFAELFLKRVRV